MGGVEGWQFRRSSRRIIVVVELDGIIESVGQGNVKLKNDLVLL